MFLKAHDLLFPFGRAVLSALQRANIARVVWDDDTQWTAESLAFMATQIPGARGCTASPCAPFRSAAFEFAPTSAI